MIARLACDECSALDRVGPLLGFFGDDTTGDYAGDPTLSDLPIDDGSGGSFDTGMPSPLPPDVTEPPLIAAPNIPITEDPTLMAIMTPANLTVPGAVNSPAVPGVSAAVSTQIQTLNSLAQAAQLAGNIALATQYQNQAKTLLAANPAAAPAGTSWFSQATILPGMSNGELLALGAGGLLLVSIVFSSKGKKR